MSDSKDAEYRKTFQVRLTNRARKDKTKLGLSKETLAMLQRQMQRLKYWNQNEEFYDYETVGEAYEFKYKVEEKWIRIFVFFYDGIAWILHAMKKKTNKLSTADLVRVKNSVSAIKRLHAEEKAEQEKHDCAQRLSLVKTEKGSKK